MNVSHYENIWVNWLSGKIVKSPKPLGGSQFNDMLTYTSSIVRDNSCRDEIDDDKFIERLELTLSIIKDTKSYTWGPHFSYIDDKLDEYTNKLYFEKNVIDEKYLSLNYVSPVEFEKMKTSLN